MDAYKFGVKTNYGHVFCSGCMLNNWNSNFNVFPITCLICRHNVTILLHIFTENETNTTDLSKVREEEHQLQDNKLWSCILFWMYAQ